MDSREAHLCWFINNGKGRFVDKETAVQATRVMSAAVFDANADGANDLLINSVDSGIELLYRLTSGAPVIQSFVEQSEELNQVTLQWRTRGADQVILLPKPGTVPASGELTITANESTTYKLQAINGIATVEATVQANVPVYREESRHDLFLLPTGVKYPAFHTFVGNLSGNDIPEVFWTLHERDSISLMAGYLSQRGAGVSQRQRY